MKRSDDYAERRAHLAGLSDEQLEERFWSLIGKLVDPLLEMGYENTSPAIERSVLLRMGFSSLEAGAMVKECLDRGLLGHGAGNIVYRLAKKRGCGIREAGLEILNGDIWDEVAELFASADAAERASGDEAHKEGAAPVAGAGKA